MLYYTDQPRPHKISVAVHNAPKLARTSLPLLAVYHSIIHQGNVNRTRADKSPLIGELASPIVSIGDPKSIVLTNQRTPIQKASPNLEREPQFGLTADHGGYNMYTYVLAIL